MNKFEFEIDDHGQGIIKMNGQKLRGVLSAEIKFCLNKMPIVKIELGASDIKGELEDFNFSRMDKNCRGEDINYE
jgi:hypothetical protein